MSTTREHTAFHVGDRVKVEFGRRKVNAFIVEARGPIGMRGRRIYQVIIPMEPLEPMTLELPEDEMEPVSEDETRKPIEKERIAEYLLNGGLVSILRSNLSGGKNQPRAWLCLDNLENLTHTFVPERGVIGGQIVPFGAVKGEKISKPQRDAVLSFIESFGLNHREAEQIVAEVGTAP